MRRALHVDVLAQAYEHDLIYSIAYDLLARNNMDTFDGS